MRTHNQPISERETWLKETFALQDEEDFVDQLHQRGISYLFLRNHPAENFLFTPSDAYLELVYQNPAASVWKVK